MARSPELNVEHDGELEALNLVLSAIGESAVNTLDDSSNADVANIRRLLNSYNRRTQTRGWTFNTETTPLLPDFYSKRINFLGDWLSVLSPTGATVYRNRGGYVYDINSRSDAFEQPITVELITLCPYNEMPEVFQQWIVAMTSRKFNMSFFGDDSLDASLEGEENELQVACMEFELDYGNFNMIEGDAWVQGRIGR